MKVEIINGHRVRGGLQGNAVRYACWLLKQHGEISVTKFREMVTSYSNISYQSSNWLTSPDQSSSYPTGKLWQRVRDENDRRKYNVRLLPAAEALVGTHMLPEEFVKFDVDAKLTKRGVAHGDLVFIETNNAAKTGILLGQSNSSKSYVEVLIDGIICRCKISSIKKIKESA